MLGGADGPLNAGEAGRPLNVQLTPKFLERGWLPPINFHVTPKFLECYPSHPYAGEASCPPKRFLDGTSSPLIAL